MTKMTKKEGFHPRSVHSARYEFASLTARHPALKKHVFKNEHGSETIDFADPTAVKELNAALLKHFYKLEWWDIPDGNLCPPIPGRADYIHTLADLLGEAKGAAIKVLDVGVGANCIYPLIGHQAYGWTFVGSDIDSQSIQAAQKILDANGPLNQFITLRQQLRPSQIFQGIILPGETFEATMCNPPFHGSREEAEKGSLRKQKNLGHSHKAPLNFGGVSNELWSPGGEVGFIGRMIEESALFGTQCSWFTTLVSKEESLPSIYRMLEKVRAIDVKTISKDQGQKKSRIVAWHF